VGGVREDEEIFKKKLQQQRFCEKTAGFEAKRRDEDKKQ